MNKKGKSTLKLMENNMRRRNYSEQTIRTYIYYASEFINKHEKDAYHISVKEAKEYIENYNYSSVSKQNNRNLHTRFL